MGLPYQRTMISFFTKKRFLVDFLGNFVDMHNHILPGIDDGAENVDDSIALLRGFGEFGIQRFIATPHIMSNLYPNDASTIHTALKELEDSLIENDLKEVNIAAAAEHMIDDTFISNVSENKVLPIRGAYLLVEMSYLQRPLNFKEAIIKVASSGLYPILAHPERYVFLHRRTHRYQKYKERGILMQMNLLSLGEYYGKEVQKVAHKLLDERIIDIVASDIHNLRQLQELKELKVSEKTLRKLLPVIGHTIETFY